MSQIEAFTETAVSLARKVQAGQFKPAEIAEAYSQRTEQWASQLNTHLFFSREQVSREVERVEALLRQKGAAELPLAGVPVLIKDNICTADMPTTCASKMLADYRPHYDATVVEKLRQAGALIFGKLNLDEFAMGSSNEHSAFGPVLNPWDRTRVAGGSSGGSAAAVAADLAPLALGSDTGGSIRQPASFCGVSGFKPSYGRVSRYGLTAFASSLDQVGSIGRSVEDLCLLTDVIAGHDRRDATSWAGPYQPTLALLKDWQSLCKGKSIGLIEDHLGEGLVPEIGAAVEAATALFAQLGLKIKRIKIPSLAYSIATYYIIATAEASSNLSRFDGVRYGFRAKDEQLALREMYAASRSQGFGTEVIQRIMMGTFILSAGYAEQYYLKAKRARAYISQEIAKALGDCDFLLGPTTPSTAFKLGENIKDPLAMYLNDICTTPANLAGLPGISLPCGLDSKGMPMGLQLMSRRHEDHQLLALAHGYQQASDWHLKRGKDLG